MAAGGRIPQNGCSCSRPDGAPFQSYGSNLRNSSGLWEGAEFETHSFSLGAQFGLLTLLVAQLIGSETTVIEFLTRGDQVEDDAGQFVSSGCDGLRSTELGSHTSIEVTEGAFAMVQRLGSHP